MAVPASGQAIVNAYLNSLGLGALGDWAWRLVSSTGNTDYGMNLLQLELPKQQYFKQQFPEYDQLVQQGRAMTPAEILSLRQQYRDIFHSAGLPAGFWDQPKDFATLIVNNVSPNEAASRVTNAFQEARNAPAQVQQAFTDLFGVDGEKAYATWALNPKTSIDVLEKQLQQARFVGTGYQYGIDLSQHQALMLAEQTGTTTLQSLNDAFQRTQEMKPLTTETISESKDITQQGALEAQFGINPSTTLDLEQRAKERQAQTGGNTSGATVGSTQTGIG